MFITLEGMEGAGKSTLLEGLHRRFQTVGRTVTLTREPGASHIGTALRAILLNTQSDIANETELFLFLADRAQHVAEIIRPALKAGHVVLCDRFADSTLVYQGCGRGFDNDLLFTLNNVAVSGLWPDITLILDLPPEEGLRRAVRRNQALCQSANEGRFEAETLAFHTRIREGFLELARQHPQRCVVLDATQSPERLLDVAWTHLSEQPFFQKVDIASE